MNESEQTPEEYQSNPAALLALIAAAWLLIIQVLGGLLRLPTEPTVNNLLKLELDVNTKVSTVIRDLNQKIMPLMAEQVTEAYVEGVKDSRQQLSENVETVEDNGEVENELNDSHRARLDTLIKQTQDDLLKATQNTENNIKLLVRKVVSKEISGIGRGGQIGKVSNMALRIEEQLRKQFLANGIRDADIAIIDRAKRKWKLRTYSEMVARTKMNNAYIEALREEARQSGDDEDLAIISTKPDTEDACLNYEGMIISLNGKSEGYLTYDQIKATKLCFHPNCGHFVRRVGGVDWIPKVQMDIHEKKMKKYWKDRDTLNQQTSQDAIN